jgi:hypothetical protein
MELRGGNGRLLGDIWRASGGDSGGKIDEAEGGGIRMPREQLSSGEPLEAIGQRVTRSGSSVGSLAALVLGKQ